MPVTANSIVTPQGVNATSLGQIISTALSNDKQYDGTMAVGTAMALIFTAGANGSYVEKVIVTIGSTAAGTPAGSTAATVVRFWLNNGAANTTATNNSYLGGVTIPVTAVSNVATVNQFEFPLNIKIPATYRIYAGLGTAIAATAAAVSLTCLGTDL